MDSACSAARASSLHLQVNATNQDGKGKAIYQSDRVFARLYRFRDGRPGKVACRDDGTPGEWLKTTAQLRDFFSADRMQPPFCLNLNHQIPNGPHGRAREGVDIDPTVLAVLGYNHSVKAGSHKYLFDQVLEARGRQGQQAGAHYLDLSRVPRRADSRSHSRRDDFPVLCARTTPFPSGAKKGGRKGSLLRHVHCGRLGMD